MPEQLLTVLAEIVARPEHIDAVRGHLLDLIGPTRQEPGCVQYDLHELNGTAGHFVFYENWESQAALDEHLATAHIREAFEKVVPLLAVPPRIVTATRLA